MTQKIRWQAAAQGAHYFNMAKKKKQRQMKKLARLLRAAASFADEIEALIGNGAEIGSIVGGIADEIESNHDE